MMRFIYSVRMPLRHEVIHGFYRLERTVRWQHHFSHEKQRVLSFVKKNWLKYIRLHHGTVLPPIQGVKKGQQFVRCHPSVVYDCSIVTHKEQIFKKMGQPQPFFIFFRFLYNLSSQQDSNLDCQRRRQGRWPLDHHHDQLVINIALSYTRAF